MPLLPRTSSGRKLQLPHGKADPKPSPSWKKAPSLPSHDSDSASDIEVSSASTTARNSLSKQISFQTRPRQYSSSSVSEHGLWTEGSADSNEELNAPPRPDKMCATKGSSLDLGRGAPRCQVSRKPSSNHVSFPVSRTDSAKSATSIRRPPKGDAPGHPTKLPVSSAKKKQNINKAQPPASSVDAPVLTLKRSHAHAPSDVLSESSSSVSSRKSSSSLNTSDKTSVSSNIDPIKKLSSIGELTVSIRSPPGPPALKVSPAHQRKPPQVLRSSQYPMSTATPSKEETSISVSLESQEPSSGPETQQGPPAAPFRATAKNQFIPPFLSPDTPSDSQSDGFSLTPTRRTHTEEDTLSYNTFVERSAGAGNRSDSQIFRSCKNSSSEHFKSCSNSDTNVWLQ